MLLNTIKREISCLQILFFFADASQKPPRLRHINIHQLIIFLQNYQTGLWWLNLFLIWAFQNCQKRTSPR